MQTGRKIRTIQALMTAGLLWLTGCGEGIPIGNSYSEVPADLLPTRTPALLQIKNLSTNTVDTKYYAAGSSKPVGEIRLSGFNQQIGIDSITFTSKNLPPLAQFGNFSLWDGAVAFCSEVLKNNAVTCTFPKTLSMAPGASIDLTPKVTLFDAIYSNFQFSVEGPSAIKAHDLLTDEPVTVSAVDSSFPLLLTKGQIISTSLEATVDALSPSGTQKAGKKMVGAIFDLVPYAENAVLTEFDVKISLGPTLFPSMITNLEIFDDQGNQIGLTKATIGTGNPASTYSGVAHSLPKTGGRRIFVKFDFSNLVFMQNTLTVSLQNIRAVGEQYGTTFSIPNVDGTTINVTP